MNALFNKDNKGGPEVRELLGFLDADIKYNKLKQEIASSTREVIKVTGKTIYDKVYKDYKEGVENDLIELIQYPIAIDAYRNYAPNNDVAHTNNGRRMRLDGEEKQAFEWLLDRDNSAMERKYFRALDTLVNHLYENEEEWKDTESYKQLTKSIFKSTDEFDEIFPIKSRLLLLKLQPGIRQCLDFDIKSRVGSAIYDKIVLNEEIDAQLMLAVKHACVYYALSWAMPRLSVSLFPEGILQGYVSDKLTTQARKPTVNNELAYAKENFENDYKKYLLTIEEIVKPALEEKHVNNKINVISGGKFLSL